MTKKRSNPPPLKHMIKPEPPPSPPKPGGNRYPMSKEEKLRSFVATASAKGNYDYCPYLHGMANGMIFMLSVIEGNEAVYLDASEEWIQDKKDSANAS